MAADDIWAQMMAEETSYARSNKHRVQKTSLASLSTMVAQAPKPKVQEVSYGRGDHIIPSVAPSACLPMPAALLPGEDPSAELEPSITTIPTRSFSRGAVQVSHQHSASLLVIYGSVLTDCL